MKKLLTIVTPSFNSKKTIRKCIESIKNIPSEKIEHIIIDGLSKDGTLEIIEKYSNTYNLKWISEKDKGIADAMNKGMILAKSEYVAWIDADNYYNYEIFPKILEILEKEKPDILCGYVAVVDKGRITKIHKPPFPFNFKKALRLNTGAIPVQPGVFFKKNLFESVKGFDTNYKIAGDYDFWLKVLKLNPIIVYMEDIFGFYKKEEYGASQSIKGIFNGFKETMRIGSKHNQALFYKFYLFIKYLKGILSIYKQNLFKK